MYSLSKNNKVNEQTSKEELDIYKLVEFISSIQKKIFELNKKMELNKKNDLFQKLSSIDEEIIKLRKIINNFNEKIKKEEMNHKKMSSYNELNNQIIEMDLEELNQITNDITSNKIIKYKDFYSISNEKINDFILEKKKEDVFKKANIDYNTITKIYQNIMNYINFFRDKKELLSENRNMLNEERLTLNSKIIENISKKESFEESAKYFLFKFFNEKTNTLILKEINTDIMNIKSNMSFNKDNFIIHLYELYIVNIDYLSKEIANQIIFTLNICKKNIITETTTKFESNTFHNKNTNNSFNLLLASKIKNEILLFINSFQYREEKEKYIDNYAILLNGFFNNLSKNIINILDYYISEQISLKYEFNLSESLQDISSLIMYLKMMFKTNYLETIIQQDSDFLNNKYKTKEEKINKEINIYNQKLEELNEKEKLYKFKLNKIGNEMNKLQGEITNDKFDLNSKDKVYFDLTMKSNKLIDNKNKLNNDFNNKVNEYEEKNKTINKEIKSKKEEIKNLQIEKKIIEEKISKRNKIIILEIHKLKLIMLEQFHQLKLKLDNYKEIHGNNLDLFDKFIQKINKSLLSTSKSLLHKNYNYLKNVNTNTITPKNKPRLTYFRQENDIKMKNDKFISFKKRHNSRDFIYKDSVMEKKFSKTLNKTTDINKEELKINYNEIKDKYCILNNPYKCYFRNYLDKNEKIFDPLSHSDLIEKKPFNFKSGFIKLLFDKYKIFFIIDSKEENLYKEIEVKNIQATIINNNIKYIIKIKQRYKIKLGKEKFFDTKEFIFKDLEDIPMNIDKKKLSINNRFFNFSILYCEQKSNLKRIEFILEGYENIKMWINALNYLIKSKNF